jgi:hypothetical protein
MNPFIYSILYFQKQIIYCLSSWFIFSIFRYTIKMKQFIAIILVLAVGVAMVTCQCDRKKCGGRSPSIGDCRRSDNVWRWNGFSCEKMPVACYDVKPKQNAFDTMQACRSLCDKYQWTFFKWINWRFFPFIFDFLSQTITLNTIKNIWYFVIILKSSFHPLEMVMTM